MNVSLKVPQAVPSNRHFQSTPITDKGIPKFPSPIISPLISPIRQANRTLQYDEAVDCSSFSIEDQLVDLSKSVSFNESSFRQSMNAHLDLAMVLREWKLTALLPVFTSKGVGWFKLQSRRLVINSGLFADHFKSTGGYEGGWFHGVGDLSSGQSKYFEEDLPVSKQSK